MENAFLRRSKEMLFFALLFFLIFILFQIQDCCRSSHVSLPTDIRFIEDPDHSLSLSHVHTLQREGRFKTIENRFGFGFTPSSYWLHLSPKEALSTSNDYLLVLNNPLMDEIEFYLLHKGNVISNKTTGSIFPFTDREIFHHHFVLPFHVPPSDDYDIYVKMRTEGTMFFPIALWNRDSFYHSAYPALFGWGIYFGFLLLMSLFHFLFYLFSRHQHYIYYGLLIFGIAIIQAVINGFAFQYLWPEWPEWNRISVVVSFAFCLIAFILFSAKFLNTRSHTPLIHAVLNVALLFYGMVIVLSFFRYGPALAMLIYSSLLTFILLFITGCIRLKQMFSPAAYYLFSFSFMVLGSMSEIFLRLGVLPSHPFIENGMRIGSVLFVLSLSRGITVYIKSTQEEYKQMKKLAITDELTGLYNRRHFFETANFERERSIRYKRPMSIIMLDLDYFKRFNDHYGHQAGDNALRLTASILKENLRKSDIIARYGGEEFIILLPETRLSNAVKVGEHLREKIEGHSFLFVEEEIRFTISVGAASLTSPDQTVYDIIRDADTALYKAKERGRNRVASFHEIDGRKE